MTSEMRTTIEAGDITAIEMECVKCHARLVSRVNDWHGTPLGCANCKDIWMTPGSTDGKKVELLVNALYALRSLKESDQIQPYQIRLEVKGIKP